MQTVEKSQASISQPTPTRGFISSTCRKRLKLKAQPYLLMDMMIVGYFNRNIGTKEVKVGKENEQLFQSH